MKGKEQKKEKRIKKEASNMKGTQVSTERKVRTPSLSLHLPPNALPSHHRLLSMLPVFFFLHFSYFFSFSLFLHLSPIFLLFLFSLKFLFGFLFPFLIFFLPLFFFPFVSFSFYFPHTIFLG